MNRNLKLLLAISVLAVLALAAFAQFAWPKTSQTTGDSEPVGKQASSPVPAGSLQVVSIKALGTGVYDKPIVHVKAGEPVKFEFSAEGDAGCGRQLIIPQFGVSLVSLTGETKTATFTPPKGVYAFHCSMNMFRGTLYAD